MNNQLRLLAGYASSAGIKQNNQDFCLGRIPNKSELLTKGAAFAIADGISTSDVSDIASKTAVTAFLEDYYSTPETWSTKHSGIKVLQAINSWLYAQTRQSAHRNDANKGYVCTIAALVVKSATAHLFHSGDTRIYRVVKNSQSVNLEQLTQDHRTVLSSQEIYLSKALGIQDYLELDYQPLDISKDDCFIICTDGIYEFIEEKKLAASFVDSQATLEQKEDDGLYHYNTLCEQIINDCLNNGSDDNLSIQVVHITELPDKQLDELQDDLAHLPFLQNIKPPMDVDEFTLVRSLYVSSRSHVYLATRKQASEALQKVVLKFPAVEMQHGEDSQTYLDSMLMEEWIAKRVDSPHVIKAINLSEPRTHFYTVGEYFEGQSLSQWLIDNPKPSLQTVRNIVAQIAKGLQALHRKQIVHQDVRLENVLIDDNGFVKLIDLGSAKVAGLVEINAHNEEILGTLAFSAPEYLSHNHSDERTDVFSLGVIAYHLLSNQLPYGNRLAQNYQQDKLGKIHYQSLFAKHIRSDVPFWVDGAIEKAVNIDPNKRYVEVAEFIYDLSHPNSAFIPLHKRPLLAQNPVLFWQLVSAILALILALVLLDKIPS